MTSTLLSVSSPAVPKAEQWVRTPSSCVLPQKPVRHETCSLNSHSSPRPGITRINVHSVSFSKTTDEFKDIFVMLNFLFLSRHHAVLNLPSCSGKHHGSGQSACSGPNTNIWKCLQASWKCPVMWQWKHRPHHLLTWKSANHYIMWMFYLFVWCTCGLQKR